MVCPRPQMGCSTTQVGPRSSPGSRHGCNNHVATNLVLPRPTAGRPAAFAVGQALFIATSNGRMKVVGREGVQTLLHSSRTGPSVALCSLLGHRAVARATTGGIVEVWSWSETLVGCVGALALVQAGTRVDVTALESPPLTDLLFVGTQRGAVHALRVDLSPDVEGPRLTPLPYRCDCT